METVTQMTLQLQKKEFPHCLTRPFPHRWQKDSRHSLMIIPQIAATITVVMIIYAYSYQMHQILNMYSIAIEIMRGIAGTIGIILTVPITSLIMSMLLTREKKAAPEKKQKCECK